ncbi:MAG: hypothetical protein Q8S15_04045 [Erysipelotrichaceae bacterium]|nr:hypothetical protein [Erysipelotrichaceae bacterium]MDP3305219.1 hypothetical protein [Erysipelotrichaceae bacterium]
MKTKNISAMIVSALTIMLGGFVLFSIGFIVLAIIINGFQLLGETPSGEVSSYFLAFAAYAVGAIALVFVAKWLLTKEQLKHTLWSAALTLLLMVVLVMIGIALYEQSDLIILLAGGFIIVPLLIYLYVKKANWTYLFATVYVACIGIYNVLMNVEI